MRRGAFVLIVVLSLAAVSAVVFTALSIGGRHITVWAMSQNASPGTRITASLVREVTIAQGSDDFTVLTTNPAGEYLAHSVSDGDVLRPDDLFTQSMVTVPLAFKSMAPGLQAGDSVDIYGPSSSTLGVGTPQAPEARQRPHPGRQCSCMAAGSRSSPPAAPRPSWSQLRMRGSGSTSPSRASTWSRCSPRACRCPGVRRTACNRLSRCWRRSPTGPQGPRRPTSPAGG